MVPKKTPGDWRPCEDYRSSYNVIFIHHDAVRKPLQAPYDGPYRVISRTKKQITIEINGQHEVVSLDHLKPAYLDTEFSLLDTTSTHSLPHTGTSNLVTTTSLRRKSCWPSNLLDQPLIVH